MGELIVKTDENPGSAFDHLILGEADRRWMIWPLHQQP
jgi:hypothetical protein